MKKRRKLIACIATLVLLVISIVPRVEAHHYVYLGEDPATQNYGNASPYTKSFIMWTWQQGQAAEWWVVPPSDPTFADDVATAREQWRTNILELGYSPAGSEASANIRFRYETPPTLRCGTPIPIGCVWYADWENRATERAYYVRQVDIYIDPDPLPGHADPDYTPQGRVSAVAHELGHVYGLHEQYQDDVTGRPGWDYTVSVMDRLVTDGNGRFVPYDNAPGIGPVQGPTALDLHRVHSYWGHIDYGHWRGDDLPIFAVATSPPWSALRTVAQFKWPDLTWTEAYHYFEVFFSSDGQNWNPTPFHYDSIYPEIGVHYLTEPRAIGYEVNRANYGQNPGWFRACVRPYFLPFARYGTQRCSNAVQLQ